jgi:hypothetical protein
MHTVITHLSNNSQSSLIPDLQQSVQDSVLNFQSVQLQPASTASY